MTRDEIVAEYWKLEDQLGLIAHSLGYTIDSLQTNLNKQSSEIIEKVRPILVRQLQYLEEMRRWRLPENSNVVVLPISRLYSDHENE